MVTYPPPKMLPRNHCRTQRSTRSLFLDQAPPFQCHTTAHLNSLFVPRNDKNNNSRCIAFYSFTRAIEGVGFSSGRLGRGTGGDVPASNRVPCSSAARNIGAYLRTYTQRDTTHQTIMAFFSPRGRRLEHVRRVNRLVPAIHGLDFV